jgi:hypothetical protein
MHEQTMLRAIGTGLRNRYDDLVEQSKCTPAQPYRKHIMLFDMICSTDDAEIPSRALSLLKRGYVLDRASLYELFKYVPPCSREEDHLLNLLLQALPERWVDWPAVHQALPPTHPKARFVGSVAKLVQIHV